MALVVFHNHGNHWLDPILKEGFKHVFCAVVDGDYWIVVDGRNGLPAVEVVAASTEDLKAFYENEGFTVIEVDRGSPLRSPLILNNCVGMVRAILGIRTSFVLTPYQLFKHLRGRHV